MNNLRSITPSPNHRICWSDRYLGIVVFLAFLAIYVRTAAPSVLAGDSAELQMAAATLGVAHPTTYPLYTLLGHVATLLVPFGDLAWRVTLLTAGCAALAVGLFCALALRLGVSRRAALIASIALGVSPGLWNAATAAEVYSLLAVLMVALAYVVSFQESGVRSQESEARSQDAATDVGGAPHRDAPLLSCSLAPLFSCSRFSVLSYALPGFVAGLGFTHHGLFAITALPPFAIWVLLQIVARPLNDGLRRLVALVLGFLAGCTPWLFPLIQFARYGPFQGVDYGLPKHYFWGAPTAWPEVFDLLTGGTVRRGMFRIPTSSDVQATLGMLWERANFEFGAIGLVLALVGGVALFLHLRGVWWVTLWVLVATTGYLLLLGPAVVDAPIFTLPMLLPLALWVAFGVQALLAGSERLVQRWWADRRVPVLAGWLVFGLLCGMSVAWADTRVEYASKRHLTLYRTFGEAVLATLPPNAVLITHWEQGMLFQYLHVVEHQRPDVWIDVVEPSDDAWGPRVARRYAGRPVFLIGQAPDVAGLPVELVSEDPYALVFRLRR